MAFEACIRTTNTTKNTSNMFVKIIFPGGHVKFYDRPVMASDIMSQNPKCWVAHPDVFQQPWAVVTPDTLLLLGQKFYVVPISTIRKLRRHFLRHPSLSYSDAPVSVMSADASSAEKCKGGGSRRKGACLLTLRRSFDCLLHPDDDELDRCPPRVSGRRFTATDAVVRSKEVARVTGKESPRRDASPKRRAGNASPGTPTFHWQPGLESIREE